MARGCNYKPPPFLSTLSLRRATVRPRCRGCPAAYFYPRSPCGERPLVHQLRGLADVSISIHALLAESDFHPPCVRHLRGQISIHALLAESDSRNSQNINRGHKFLSTLSLRRATSSLYHGRNSRIFLSTLSLRRATSARSLFSIHFLYFYPRSPCGERRVLTGGSNCDGYFYPRSPCGERLLWVLRKVPILGIFLSTLSLRRATIIIRVCYYT